MDGSALWRTIGNRFFVATLGRFSVVARSFTDRYARFCGRPAQTKLGRLNYVCTSAITLVGPGFCWYSSDFRSYSPRYWPERYFGKTFFFLFFLNFYKIFYLFLTLRNVFYVNVLLPLELYHSEDFLQFGLNYTNFFSNFYANAAVMHSHT